MFILQEASLSVLGYGVPQEIATWGNIINVITNAGSIRYDWLGYWWMWLPCAAVLVLFVLAINFIGDGPVSYTHLRVYLQSGKGEGAVGRGRLGRQPNPEGRLLHGQPCLLYTSRCV